MPRAAKMRVPVEVMYPKGTVITPLTEYTYPSIYNRARCGSPCARNEMILGFLGLANSIASTWAAKFRGKAIDIFLTAGCSVCEAVDSIISEKTEIEFTHASKRVHLRVRGAIISFIRSDQVVIPPKYSEWLEKKIKEFGYEWFLETNMTMLYMDTIHAGEEESVPEMHFGRRDLGFDFIMNDLVTSQAFTPREIEVIRYRVDGYTQTEIAQKMGCHQTWVFSTLKNLAPRVRRLCDGRY